MNDLVRRASSDYWMAVLDVLVIAALTMMWRYLFKMPAEVGWPFAALYVILVNQRRIMRSTRQRISEVRVENAMYGQTLRESIRLAMRKGESDEVKVKRDN